MASLEGGVFAITGGASGMGLATCRRLASLKAKAICIGDFNDANFAEVKKELEGINSDVKVSTTKIDVSNSSQVDSWIEGIASEHGDLTGAVNAAGVPQTVGARSSPTILEETDQSWERVMGINLNGIFFCTRAQVKAMTSFSKKSRAIVNISSMASLQHGADTYAYGASKAANAYFTTCVSKDVKGLGIRVNAVSPSATMTPMLAQFFAKAPSAEEMSAMDTMGYNIVSADDIAKACIWLLSDDAGQVVGINMAVGDAPP